MQNLNINSGELRITINDDPNRVIVFNPKDELFAEKFYQLMGYLKAKSVELESRADAIDAVKDVDELGVPTNMQERFDFLKETCTLVRQQIDLVFGEGTSQIAFGDVLSLDAFAQFFDGIKPFMQSARTEKVQKYMPKPKAKSRKRK